MAEEEEERAQEEADAEAAEDQEAADEEEEQEGGGQKIMCFVSKEMVPINETVEVEYGPGKKVRVLPKYIKYDQEKFGEEAEA